MNRKYIDFAPARNTKSGQSVKAGASRQGVTVIVPQPKTAQNAGVRTRTIARGAAVNVGGSSVRRATAAPQSRVARRTTVTTVKATKTVRPGVARQVAGGTARTAVTLQPKEARRVVGGSAETLRPKVVRQTPTTAKNDGGLSLKTDLKLGEIEDVNPRFVTTDVPKRPLSDGKSIQKAETENISKVKARKLGGRLRGRKNANTGEATKKSVVAGGDKAAGKTTSAYVVPKSPFINQDKVVKRPLSKNMYQKEVPVQPNADSKKPVTIITKPKKESHVGIVVTIILTIIFGAVAGTVAFLLLPK